uniref:Uncharacterized protein n=1 Tax=Parascaris equorum TaxID=6256 RepID=A0A914S3J3_PAREQ
MFSVVVNWMLFNRRKRNSLPRKLRRKFANLFVHYSKYPLRPILPIRMHGN